MAVGCHDYVIAVLDGLAGVIGIAPDHGGLGWRCGIAVGDDLVPADEFAAMLIEVDVHTRDEVGLEVCNLVAAQLLEVVLTPLACLPCRHVGLVTADVDIL